MNECQRTEDHGRRTGAASGNPNWASQGRRTLCSGEVVVLLQTNRRVWHTGGKGVHVGEAEISRAVSAVEFGFL